MYSRAELINDELARIDGTSIGEPCPKHQKMALSPFVFYRGSAQLFYADIANHTIQLPAALKALPLTTIMGDCHTSNFGFFTEEGSHGERVIFAANDFDDACIGRPEWDLLRFAVSLILSAKHCQQFASSQQPVADDALAQQAIEAFLLSYIECCRAGLEGQEHLQYALTDEKLEAYGFLNKFYQKAQKRAVGGKSFLNKSTLAKAVDFTGDMPVFKVLPEKLQPLNPQQYQELERVFAPYMHDRIWDIVARKNAGTGSVNMGRYYFLVGPASFGSEADIALFHLVEVKKQRQAAAVDFFPGMSVNNQLNPAHLTVMCQRKMQRYPDLVLDEIEWNKEHWLVRSRHHAKLGMDPEDIALGEKAINQNGFIEYAQACGYALALAHCRGDRRSTIFERKVCELLPDNIAEIQKLAVDYSECAISDWQWLKTTQC